MELHQLRTFVAVAEEGGLTRAADRLHLSQPAMSGHIRALEEEFGVALFCRTPKGMTPTREGVALLDRARQALSRVEDIAQEARRLKGEIMGDVRIGLNTLASLLRVLDLTGTVSERYPNLNLHVIMATTGRVLDLVRSGGLDGGFFYGDNPFAEIRSVFLRRANMVIAAPAGWVDPDAPPSWKELAGHPWVLTPEHCFCSQSIRSRFKACGAFPAKATTVEDDDTLFKLISGGRGIGPMVRDEALKARDQGLVVLLDDVLDTTLSFGWLRTRDNDPLIRAVLSGLGEVWGLDPFAEGAEISKDARELGG